MDLSKFDSGSFSIAKTDRSNLTATLRVTAPKGTTHDQLQTLWKNARAEILSDPSVAGLTLDPEKNEDVSLGLQKRSINATLRFLAPKS